MELICSRFSKAGYFATSYMTLKLLTGVKKNVKLAPNTYFQNRTDSQETYSSTVGVLGPSHLLYCLYFV